MTYGSEEFSDLLRDAGWSRRQLAERMDVQESYYRKRPEVAVPSEVVFLLRTLVAVIDANPLPKGC